MLAKEKIEEIVGKLSDTTPFAVLLDDLIRGAGFESSYAMSMAMPQANRVNHQTINNYRNLEYEFALGVTDASKNNLKEIAGFLGVDQYQDLLVWWNRLLALQPAQVEYRKQQKRAADEKQQKAAIQGGTQASTAGPVSGLVRNVVSQSTEAAPEAEHATLRKRSRAMPVLLSIAALAIVAIGAWLFLGVGASLFHRGLTLKELDLTVQDYAGPGRNLTKQLDRKWPAIELAAGSGDPIALTLLCIRAGEDALAGLSPLPAARSACESAAATGEIKAASYLQELASPAALRPEDVGLTSQEWLEAPPEAIVSKLDAGKKWSLVDARAEAFSDALAFTLQCFRVSVGTADQPADKARAMQLCEQGKARGDGRAAAYLAPPSAPLPLTLADVGLSQRVLDTEAYDVVARRLTAEQWALVDSKPGDARALMLRCFRSAISPVPSENLKAKGLCQQSSDAGEARATFFLAFLADGHLGEKADPALNRTLLERAVGQGSVAARLTLYLKIVGNKADASTAYDLAAQYFDAMPNPPCFNDVGTGLLRFAQQNHYGYGTERKPERAIQLYSDIVATCTKPGPLTLTSLRWISGDLILRATDISNFVQLGDPAAPVQVFMAAQLGCQTCRDFLGDDFAAFKEKYIDTRIARFSMLPFWNGPGENTADFMAHYGVSCLPPADRLNGFLRFFGPITAGGEDFSKADADTVGAAARALSNEPAFTACIGDASRLKRYMGSAVEIFRNVEAIASRLIINGRVMSAGDREGIAAEMAKFSGASPF